MCLTEMKPEAESELVPVAMKGELLLKDESLSPGKSAFASQVFASFVKFLSSFSRSCKLNQQLLRQVKTSRLSDLFTLMKASYSHLQICTACNTTLEMNTLILYPTVRLRGGLEYRLPIPYLCVQTVINYIMGIVQSSCNYYIKQDLPLDSSVAEDIARFVTFTLNRWLLHDVSNRCLRNVNYSQSQFFNEMSPLSDIHPEWKWEKTVDSDMILSELFGELAVNVEDAIKLMPQDIVNAFNKYKDYECLTPTGSSGGSCKTDWEKHYRDQQLIVGPSVEKSATQCKMEAAPSYPKPQYYTEQSRLQDRPAIEGFQDMTKKLVERWTAHPNAEEYKSRIRQIESAQQRLEEQKMDLRRQMKKEQLKRTGELERHLKELQQKETAQRQKQQQQEKQRQAQQQKQRQLEQERQRQEELQQQKQAELERQNQLRCRQEAERKTQLESQRRKPQRTTLQTPASGYGPSRLYQQGNTREQQRLEALRIKEQRELERKKELERELREKRAKAQRNLQRVLQAPQAKPVASKPSRIPPPGRATVGAGTLILAQSPKKKPGFPASCR